MGAVGVHVNATNLVAAEADPDVTTKGVVDNTKEELERLRATLTTALATAGGSYVAANFAPIVGHGATATNTPSALDAWDGGHWSPLAAYAPSADAVLVLDVARCVVARRAARRESRRRSSRLPAGWRHLTQEGRGWTGEQRGPPTRGPRGRRRGASVPRTSVPRTSETGRSSEKTAGWVGATRR